MPADHNPLAERLARVVGADHVLAEPELKAGYERDLTGRYAGEALLVVRPAGADEVAGVLRECAAAGTAVVPQGGHTGMVGGGTPRNGEVVLATTRLTGIEDLDEAASQVTCGAGVPLAALQGFVRERGFDFGVDLPARGTATIGGMTATNAGGAFALRYGTMRAQVAGLEAVLADGSRIERLGGLLKDTAGMDLAALLVGSEGTLGVVTRVRLRLVPRLPKRVTALLAFRDTARALEVLGVLRRSAPSLHAFDYMHAPGLRRVCERFGLPPPFHDEHDVVVVAECAATEDPSDELLAVADLVEEAAVATEAAEREALWRYRELHNEAITALGVPHKLDVSVPPAAVPAFERDVGEALRELAPDAELILFGHLGDGNVHVNVLGPPPEDERVDETVLRLVRRHRGSIAAEHGVGVAKTRWLQLTRSPEEIEAMRAIKHALDPGGLLAPGRMLP